MSQDDPTRTPPSHPPPHPPPPPESRLKHAGALLGGSAAFIAAVTTAWVNLRNAPAPAPAPAQSHSVQAAKVASPAPADVPPPAPPPPPPPAPPPPPPGPVQQALVLERIAVDHDGASGTADWRFEVSAGETRVMAISQELDDSPGKNVVPIDHQEATVSVPADAALTVHVKGWRHRAFHGGSEPDATGEGTLNAKGEIEGIRVQAAKPEDGDFLFTFRAKPAD